MANLESLNNLVYQHSTSVLSAALKCSFILVREIFCHSSCSYCFFFVVVVELFIWIVSPSGTISIACVLQLFAAGINIRLVLLLIALAFS